MNVEEFVKETKKLGIVINENQQNLLENYYLKLVEENKKTNLTRIIKKEDVYLKHFYDSLTITKSIDLNGHKTLCDVGSGAGFPGIVLKIIYPKLDITLIDSNNKKTKFLEKIISELKLEKISVKCERTEKHQKQYDIVVARAVAKLNILLEICTPITKTNGYFIAMKANAIGEIEEAKKALNELNCEIESTLIFELPIEKSTRTIIKIKKMQATDKKYPRNFDKISKNPL